MDVRILAIFIPFILFAIFLIFNRLSKGKYSCEYCGATLRKAEGGVLLGYTSYECPRCHFEIEIKDLDADLV